MYIGCLWFGDMPWDLAVQAACHCLMVLSLHCQVKSSFGSQYLGFLIHLSAYRGFTWAGAHAAMASSSAAQAAVQPRSVCCGPPPPPPRRDAACAPCSSVAGSSSAHRAKAMPSATSGKPLPPCVCCSCVDAGVLKDHASAELPKQRMSHGSAPTGSRGDALWCWECDSRQGMGPNVAIAICNSNVTGRTWRNGAAP